MISIPSVHPLHIEKFMNVYAFISASTIFLLWSESLPIWRRNIRKNTWTLCERRTPTGRYIFACLEIERERCDLTAFCIAIRLCVDVVLSILLSFASSAFSSTLLIWALVLDLLLLNSSSSTPTSFGYSKRMSLAGYALAEMIKMSVAIWLGSSPFRAFLKKKWGKRRLTHDLLDPTHLNQPQY